MARVECPKCRGTMEVGFLIDATYGGNGLSQWVEGVPLITRWSGLKIKGRRKIPSVTNRCTKCGYLESYAPGQG